MILIENNFSLCFEYRGDSTRGPGFSEMSMNLDILKMYDTTMAKAALGSTSSILLENTSLSYQQRYEIKNSVDIFPEEKANYFTKVSESLRSSTSTSRSLQSPSPTSSSLSLWA